MKISDKTISFLKNVANINKSITILPGNIIRTMGPDKEIMMRVEIEETFDTTVRIFELSRLLGVVGMFQDPELEFGETSVTIKDNATGGKVKYMYAAEDVCPKPLTKDLPMNEADIAVEFDLSAKDFAAIMKAASILGVSDISVVGEDGNLKLVAHDKAVASTDNFSITLGSVENAGSFSLDFKVEKMKLIPSDYTVRISNKRISHFRSDDLNVDYWIGLEYTSSFDGK